MADMGDEQMMDISNNDGGNFGGMNQDNNNEPMITESIPRLNGEMLQSGEFQGNEVSIVGAYIGPNQADNTIQEFQASDNRKFTVKLNIDQPWDGYQTKFIEVRGFVNNDGSITQNSYQEYGNEFAMSTW
eukprot:CAMPEP_0201571860 /NCGR_PEP_ID=MMETSP0190_2-20130828/14832_1 /ASSEMBLY_ACC=CAM_ASM_000263 /TAXON_ID=37353 /ORGANISM="Rosalina sp." /LENGTH=129 /DNA_ID=CAMNT_0047996973 /DNA_START=154 /DNA_END=540 /DNA_ORIENTATION=+